MKGKTVVSLQIKVHNTLACTSTVLKNYHEFMSRSDDERLLFDWLKAISDGLCPRCRAAIAAAAISCWMWLLVVVDVDGVVGCED